MGIDDPYCERRIIAPLKCCCSTQIKGHILDLVAIYIIFMPKDDTYA